MSLGEAAAFLLDKTLSVFLSRERRRGLGNYIASRASGDGNSDHQTNGERRFMDRAKQVLSQQAPPTITAIDAGANVGHWTHCFAEGLGADLTVYAFEPVKHSFDELTQNLAQWKLPPSVIPVMAALSREDGQAPIFINNDQSSELNSLHQRHTGATGLQFRQGETVRLVKGDTFCSQKAIERVDFLKIDTEGHEMAVMAGFARMFTEKRIEIVQFEYGGAWLDARTQLLDAFDLLSRYGYIVAKLHPGGIKIHERYTPALETFRYANFVAFLPKWAGLFNVIR